jgi:hypothetical protein
MRDWGDHYLSVDWTPIRPDAAGTSAHRIRPIAGYAVNGRVGPLSLGGRAGVGIDFLRLARSSERRTLAGYAFEVGAGAWFVAGPWQIGAEVAAPFALNGNATVGDLQLDSYVSADLDLLVGVRHVSR